MNKFHRVHQWTVTVIELLCLHSRVDKPRAFAKFPLRCLRRAGREIKWNFRSAKMYFFLPLNIHGTERSLVFSCIFCFYRILFCFLLEEKAEKNEFFSWFPVYFHFLFRNNIKLRQTETWSPTPRLEWPSKLLCEFLLWHRFAFNDSEIIHIKCRSEEKSFSLRSEKFISRRIYTDKGGKMKARIPITAIKGKLIQRRQRQRWLRANHLIWFLHNKNSLSKRINFIVWANFQSE